ncbi:Fringe glycosyltransferase [Trichostrongylus colubriformis]|uniref:Fringe glycosyltransferase n=1 Tax=Trichostrongylus colubriformis TaxID=6319 RepID=A0AAN8FJH5_TRICO
MNTWAFRAITVLFLITVFSTATNDFLVISVRTTKKFHKTRLKDILDTWYQDAGQEVYFFTDRHDMFLKIRLGAHFIETDCSAGHDRHSLCCKMNHELMFFLANNSSWSCHFDDDNYVNIKALRRFLSSMSYELPWYLGKMSTASPIKVSSRNGRKVSIWFSTGGAGICLSRELLKRLSIYVVERKFEASCAQYMLPDDVTLGVIITHILKVPLTVVHELHSHLEPLLHMQLSDIPYQVSFGGSERPHGLHGIDLPTAPVPDDPLRFRALHSYLKSIR